MLSRTKHLITLSALILIYNIHTIGLWHDHYRIIQILIITTTSLATIIYHNKWLIFIHPTILNHLITTFLLSGIISTIINNHKLWSSVEIAILVGSFGLFNWILNYSKNKSSMLLDIYITLFTFSFCAIFSILFFVEYTISIYQSAINAQHLIPTFNNPRFFGQLMTLSLPIMGASLANKKNNEIFNSVYIAKTLIFIIAWLLVISNGTRGTWLAITVVAVIIYTTGLNAKKWVHIQIFGGATGAILTWLLIYLIPSYLNISVTNPPNDRLNFGLSAREIIWTQAWEMIKTAPWFGHGPMHFAQIHSTAGAHPHQILLQLASEWGSIATICFCILSGWAIISMLGKIRILQNLKDPKSMLYIGLSTAVSAALVQSMVDGVWIMPYTQIVFTTFSAFTFAIHNQKKIKNIKSTPPHKLDHFYNLLLVLSVIILLYCLVPSSPLSLQNSLNYTNTLGQYRPRFWTQGFI